MENELWYQMIDATNQPTSEQIKLVHEYSSDDLIAMQKCSICGMNILGDIELHNQKNKHMIEIIPNLYLGNWNNANNLHELIYTKIDIIINVAYELPNAFPNKFTYLKVMWDDCNNENILLDLDNLTNFIQQHIGKSKILIHCQQGMSRSPSLIIAYLIRFLGYDYYTALDYIRIKKPNIEWSDGSIEYLVKPNDGFKQQLINFSEKIDKVKFYTNNN